MNPCSFKNNDIIYDIYRGTVYRVIENNNKKGMAKLLNLSNGNIEDWNAYNNNMFEKFLN